MPSGWRLATAEGGSCPWFVAEDLPGPPQLAPPKNFPDKDVIFMKVQHELTRAREDVRSEDIRACYEGLPASDPTGLCGRTIPNSARTVRPSRDLSHPSLVGGQGTL